MVFGARQSLHSRRALVLLPPQALHFHTPVVATGAFTAGFAVFDAAVALPARARVSRTGLLDTPMLNVLELVASVDGTAVGAVVPVALAAKAGGSFDRTEATAALVEPLPNVSELIAAAAVALASPALESSSTAPGVAPSVEALAGTRSPTTSPLVELSTAAIAGGLHSSSSPSGSDWLSATQSLVGVSWKSFFCGFGSAGSASTWCTGIVSVVLGTSDIVFRRFADDSGRLLLDASMDTGVRIASRSSFFFAPPVAVAGVVLSAAAV